MSLNNGDTDQRLLEEEGVEIGQVTPSKVDKTKRLRTTLFQNYFQVIFGVFGLAALFSLGYVVVHSNQIPDIPNGVLVLFGISAAAALVAAGFRSAEPPEQANRPISAFEMIFASVFVVCGVVAAFSVAGAVGRHGNFPDIPAGMLILFGTSAVAALVAKGIKLSNAITAVELEPVLSERKAILEPSASRSSRPTSYAGSTVGVGELGAATNGHTPRSPALATDELDRAIQLQLNQLTEYYTINKGQARNSFSISIGATTLGLLALCFGIYFTLNRQTATAVSTLSAITGVLLQFIGAAYFYIYNRSLQQLNFFYESLVRFQDIMLSVRQVDLLGAENRDRVREAIVKVLIRGPVAPPKFVAPTTSKTRGKSTRAGEAAVV